MSGAGCRSCKPNWPSSGAWSAWRTPRVADIHDPLDAPHGRGQQLPDLTGTAPTTRTVAATCLNGVSGRTVTTGVVMMSLTVLLIPIAPFTLSPMAAGQSPSRYGRTAWSERPEARAHMTPNEPRGGRVATTADAGGRSSGAS